MRGNASKYANAQLSASSAKAQMIMELCSCTDEAFFKLKVSDLVARYRVFWKVAAQQIDIEAQRRRERNAELTAGVRP